MTERYDWASHPEEDMARIQALPPEAMVREILSRDPHASGTELREILANAGHSVTKAACQRWREAFRQGPRPGPVEAREPVQASPMAEARAEAERRLAEALRVGDTRTAAALAAVVGRLAALPADLGPAPGEGPADLSKLTQAEAMALHYLISKAQGVQAVDQEQAEEWRAWASVFAGAGLD